MALFSVIAVLVVKHFNGSIFRNFGFTFFSLSDISLFNSSSKAVLLSLLFLQFYIPATAAFLFKYFEKTQSSLIILFCFFLFGCQFEIARFIIALFNLKETYSQLYLLLGNYTLLGKFISVFSFYVLASECKQTQKLDVELDLIIIFTVSVVITFYIPLNTAVLSSTFTISWGYSKIIFILIALTVLLTFLAFLFNYHETENKNILFLLLSSILIMSGKFLLVETDRLIYIILGALSISLGTRLFMKTAHKMYLWD